MEKKKSLVLQCKFLEEYKIDAGDNGQAYYIFGVAFKNGDAGKYTSKDRNQEYFKEGQEVEYQIERDEKEPKNSKIKPIYARKDKPADKLTNSEYTFRKIADAVAFSASYAKDIVVAHSNKEFVKTADEIFSWQKSKLEEL